MREEWDEDTFDDPVSKRAKSFQLGGDNGMNSPPAPALAERGIVGNVRGCLDRVAPGLGILIQEDIANRARHWPKAQTSR
jgi:hypothetical protein